MKIKTSLIFPVLLICCVILSFNKSYAEDNFYAYYTKLEIGNIVEDTYGKYADIVINLSDDKQVLFSRESSYLPCLKTNNGKWYFAEIVERNGDGGKLRPDKFNRYSYVRLIKNTPEKIIVHWRYVPDFNRIELNSYVEEYFTFYPDGKVERTVRQGSAKLDEWEDPANVTLQVLNLNEQGIKVLSLNKSKLTTTDLPAVNGSRVVEETVAAPAMWFKFDEGQTTRKYDARDLAQETVQENDYLISGNKTVWKKGVSGTSLLFDGYNSSITVPADKVPKAQDMSDGFTLEAWIAVGAYSWRWSPIVHQSEFGKRGYYLGIDYAGRLGLMANVGGRWEQVVSKDNLERFKWIHVAGTFNIDDGLLCIYINGELISCNRTKIEINPEVDEEIIGIAEDRDLLIGLNDEMMQAANAHRQWTYPAIHGFNGLIDEVRIYDEPLSWDQIRKSYELYKPDDNVIINPDMDARKFPANPEGIAAEEFGAEYTKLDYYESWDNMWRVGEHSDIVVNFKDKAARFAFWRGLSYGIGMITENGKWSGDQSREDWGEDYARGCCEHMSDKQCRHSHVRIIENTDARVVVHWRYGEVDVKYKFVDVDGPFADEYWTFYPDGVGIRHVASGVGGWQETMFYSEPGTRPEDNVDLNALTVIDEKGNRYEFDWRYNYPFAGEPKPAYITMINMKSDYKPFYIYPSGSTVETFVPPLVRRDYSAFHWANHYPVSQMASDGRSAEATDRAAHSSLVWGDPTKDYLMVGLTDKDAAELMPLANSWNYPAKLSDVKGCVNNGYKPEERAYMLDRTEDVISFSLNGSEKSVIYNPAFVISNWNGRDQAARVNLNGEELQSGSDFEQGVVFDTNGQPQLIIWIELESTETVSFVIE